ncbi:MAG: hypothetical protein HYX84_08515 [Chloroflexi bacterium]|nr:hypothetical protein [Chloroflexota bacterium]
MCQVCGCKEFVAKGQEAIRNRVLQIVAELRITPENTDDYECVETISGMIAPFGAQKDEVYETAVWISDLHRDGRGFDPGIRYQAHVKAFRDIFARLPAQGTPKHIATTWHQLEQLARLVDEEGLGSLGPEMRKVIEAVNHVHDDRTRQPRLRERYSL